MVVNIDTLEKLSIRAILAAPERLLEETDLQLRQLHHRIFQAAANLRAGKQMSVGLDELKAVHELILAEIRRRNLRGEFKTLKATPSAILKVWRPNISGLIAGEASHYVYPQLYKRNYSEPVYLADRDHVLAIAKLSEPEQVKPKQLKAEIEKHQVDPAVIQSRWPNARQFFIYPVELIELFERPLEYVATEQDTSWIEPAILRRKDHYDETYFQGLLKADTNFVIELAEVLNQLVGETVLELGCGTGRALDILKASGLQASGVDVSSYAIDYCRKQGHEVVLADVEDLPFDDGQVDSVFSCHVLEHLEFPDKALRESLRLAKRRVVHLVPLGGRADYTHSQTYFTLEDLRKSLLAMDLGGMVPVFHRIESTDAALVVFNKELPQLPLLQYLKSFTVVPNFASIAGSSVTSSDPMDTDMVWRSAESIGKMEVKLRNLLQGADIGAVDHHLNPQGPHGDHLPVYDLVARLKPNFQVVKVDEPRKQALAPLKRFKPLKTGKGYTQQEFFTPEQILFWARGFFKDGVPLAVEQKYNGYRTVIQSDGKGTLIYFEDTADDRSKQFPGLVADLKAIGKPVILDADLGAIYDDGKPVDRKELGALISKTKIVDPDGKFETASGDPATLVVHVFDALYWDGKDLHKQPWAERRQVLEQILGKADTKLMTLGKTKIVDTPAELKREVQRVSKLPGSEGAVIKATNSDYPLTGQSMAWAKIKNALEVKVEVLRRSPVKGSPKVWNYWVAYRGKDGKPVELGKTFNTKVDAKPGDVLTLHLEEVIPKLEDGKWLITAVVPIVADIEPDGKPETLESIVRRAALANVLQAPPKIRAALIKDKIIEKQQDAPEIVVKQREGNLDFKEGDEGTGVLQTHERGLTEVQTKLTNDFGWTPIELTAVQLNRLRELSDKDAKSAYKQAQEGDSRKLNELIASIDVEQASKADQRLIALVDPISVHTDFRLRPGKEPYWEGGEGFTPGNQFQSNKFRQIVQDGFTGKVLMNFKVPAVPEAGKGKGTAVIRGPIAWMQVGDGKPEIFPPGAVGSTAKAYSRFFVRDKFKWTAGIQDRHYKEFKLEGDQLKGRFIIQYVPTGPGERQWMLSKPNKQEYDSEVLKSVADGDLVSWEAVIVKNNPTKRLVTAVVLNPETTDAQGDIISAEVIEKAAHQFVSDLVKGSAKLGYMHDDFGRKILLVESFIAPTSILLGPKHIPTGAWVMTVKVLDDEIWGKILKGEIRGFSIGGRAKATRA